MATVTFAATNALQIFGMGDYVSSVLNQKLVA